MATAQGPELAMADPSPHTHLLEDGSSRSSEPHSSHISHQDAIGHNDAPPNPPFVFPARVPSPSQAPTMNTRASRRRPMSALEPQKVIPDSPPRNSDRQRRSVALPAFSFNPGASLPPDPESFTLLSPPMTPSSGRPLASPSRPAGHGHRRGGSEFVGGSIRDGNSIAVMSTSPTRSESGFASPGLAPPPRRGHRRGVSGAISTNDLPILAPLPDFAMPRSGSAPNSPTAFNPREGIPIPMCDQPPKLPEPAEALKDTRPTTADEDSSLPLTPVTPASEVESCGPRQARPGRTRVGFSDKLEYIPRPLSLVSNETSSTATARPGHSVSGSISSVVSAASPTGRDSPAPLSRSPTRDLTDSRPSTAGAILEHTTDVHVGAVPNTSPKRRNSTPTLLHLAETQAPVEGPPNPAAIAKTPKRWSFFGLESPFVHATGATKRRPSSSSSSGSVSRAISGTSSSDHEDSDGTETGRDAAVASKAIKKKSKKKRVKGWAGSILPLKPKVHKKRSKMSDVRPPTPPASIGPFEDEDDEAEGPQLPDPELPAPQVTITESPDITKDASMNQRPLSKDDASHPMIDLDAALGPFNTPLPHNPEWEAAQRAAGNTGKRRLHSAQGMKGFSGPGMHYHRRAESAPDLPPFDPGRAGINRFGSNSTMADVFEEDEEDDEPASAGEQQKGSGIFAAVDSSDSDSDDGEATPPATVPSLPTGSTIRDTPSSCDTVLPARQGRPAVHDFEQAAAHSVRTECSKTSLQDDVIAEEPPSIIYRSLNSMQGGTDSVGSSPRRLSSTKDLTPVDVGALHQGGPGNMPISPYSTSHASSSHPSPRSPMSMDAQRISTAPSSVTDENSFQSLLMGEPGPEVRISMDYDIPSLTSSNSTMTRDSVFSPNPRLSQPSLREQRPVSVSSAAFGRRRSSLVSLSRLISSSHGERSKLSMEVTLDNDSDNKRPRSKGSKTKQRLGRMMQFWKPNKDGAPS